MFDPRKGQDYKFGLNPKGLFGWEEFSSLDANLMVLTGFGRMFFRDNLAGLVRFASNLVRETAVAQLGFLSMYPASRRILREAQDLAPDLTVKADSFLHYFDPCSPELDSLLEFCMGRGTYEECILGSCTSHFSPPETKSTWRGRFLRETEEYDIGYFLKRHENFSALVFFDLDFGGVYVWTPLFDEIDELLSSSGFEFRPGVQYEKQRRRKGGRPKNRGQGGC